MVISRHSSFIPLILQEFHRSLVVCNGGILWMNKRIQESFYLFNMAKDIQKFVSECFVCQAPKYSTLHHDGLLQPLPIPDRVWEDISLDFVEGLPYSSRKNVILVVVGRLTKHAHFFSLRHPFTATDLALLFIG